MKRKTGMILSLVMLSLAVAAAGCGQKPNIEMDSKKTVDGIKADSVDMESKELKKYALGYSEEIRKVKDRMRELQSRLKTLKPAEIAGEHGTAIKSEFASLTLKATQLTKRYDVYAEKYLKKGGNLSEVTVS